MPGRIHRHFYATTKTRIVRNGLSAADVLDHLASPEADSRTATGTEATQRTRRFGRWFDMDSATAANMH